MPGTIQVSVLELMDLPSESSTTHLLSLKALVGKREFKSEGMGDFSIPLVSLRENLILMLIDMDGNVVARTDIKIMSVVQKGIWVDLFPLKGGGRVHLKLQFSLGEEDRKRIREMREDVLKRKQGEILLKVGLKSAKYVQMVEETQINRLQDTDAVKDSFSSKFSPSCNLKDEHGNTSRLVSLQKLQEQAAPHGDVVSKEIIKIRPPPEGIQERNISSEKCLDTHIGNPGSLVLGSDPKDIGYNFAGVEEDQMHSPKRKSLLQEHSDKSSEQAILHREGVNKEVIKIQPPPDGIRERRISSKKCLETQIASSGSFVSGSDTGDMVYKSAGAEEDQMPSSKKKNLIQEHPEEPSEPAIPHQDAVHKEISGIQPLSDVVQERHISSEKCLDTHIGSSGLLDSASGTEVIIGKSAGVEEDEPHSPKRQKLLQRSSNSNIRKMISAFENNTSQGPGAYASSRAKHLSKNDSGDSYRRASSRERETEKVKHPQTIAKSFSAETLSDISFQQSPKFFKSPASEGNEDMLHLDHSTRRETSGTDFKNLETSKHNAVEVKDGEGSFTDIPPSAQSKSSQHMDTILQPTEADTTISLSGYAESAMSSEVAKGSIKSSHSEFDALDKKIDLPALPNRELSFDALASQGTSDTTPLCDNSEEAEASSIGSLIHEINRSRDEIDDGIGTIEQTVADYFEPRVVDFELVPKEVTENEEHPPSKETQLSRKKLQYESSSNEILKDNDFICRRSSSDVQTVSGFPSDTELSTFYDYEKYPLRNLGIWIPRRLCVTTGSNQLRNLDECSSLHVRTHSAETNLSSMETNEKQKMQDDICTEGSDIEKISYSSEKSYQDIFKLHRGLIEQGVWILTVLVACGTLLNTR